MFQQYSLYPHLSVFENLAFPLRSPARKMSEPEMRQRVEEVAKLVRIDHKLENRSTKLSGGEMQRVAIGRALVRKPAIYLMDEPLSSLDAKLRAELRLELKRIQTELGATMLYVTHDQIEAMTMADRIGILADGVLVQIGTPRTIYTQPANLHVAARLGQPAINLLPVGLLPDAERPTGTKTIGARTEHLTIEKAANGHADGTVDWVEHLGDQNHLHVTVKDKKLVTLDRPRHAVQEGRPGNDKTAEPAVFRRRGQQDPGGMNENRLLHVLVDDQRHQRSTRRCSGTSRRPAMTASRSRSSTARRTTMRRLGDMLDRDRAGAHRRHGDGRSRR